MAALQLVNRIANFHMLIFDVEYISEVISFMHKCSDLFVQDYLQPTYFRLNMVILVLYVVRRKTTYETA